MEAEGIPPDLIWIESRSRTTHENALYSSEILRQHGVPRVALVTDASSMPRATACFRKLGIDVVPAPFQFFNVNHSLRDMLPEWENIEANGLTLHEVVGLLWYRLHGWI
jgi:uncharacterized SAM-binding protein YcdF (DUF218 family)